MKSKIISFCTAGVFVTALAFAALMPTAPNVKAAPAAASAAEHHPEIHDAIESLKHAREHMAHAAHDFGGHREEAIRATDEAIRQLEICLKYE